MGNSVDDDVVELAESSFSATLQGAIGSLISPMDPKSYQNHLNVLSKHFGHTAFRSMQWQIIDSVLNEKRDNCCVMATGYGKSLCYQFPAVYSGGISIVISPLISLMEDQVKSLEVSNISACFLGTAQDKKREVRDDIMAGVYRLVYVTPEYISGDCGDSFLLDVCQSQNVILIAIDEAHCVSKWGHDFRPAYRHLGKLREMLPNIPMLAVTATATESVRKDIVKSLKLRNPQMLCSSLDRPNLYFSVSKKSGNPWNDISKVLHNERKMYNIENGSVIIYCLTKKTTETVVQLLQSHGVKCASYHAGMLMKTRKQVHEQFVKDEIKIIVATIAFGMGIDKPNVRCVIHYGASSDMESYYQEAGRAGRDGQPSLCVLYHAPNDFITHKFLRELSLKSDEAKSHKESLNTIMKQYVSWRECRRHFIMSYFEKSLPPPPLRQNCCDDCTRRLSGPSDFEMYNGIDVNGNYDFSEDAYKFLKVVEFLYPKRFGLAMIVSFIRGSRSKKMNPSWFQSVLHGIGKVKSENWWKEVGIVLECLKYIRKESMQLNMGTVQLFTIDMKGRSWLRSKDTGNYEPIISLPTEEVVKCLEFKHKPKITPLFDYDNQSSNVNIVSRSTDSTVSSTTFSQDTFYNGSMEYIELDEKGELMLKELLYVRHSLAQSQNINPHTILSDLALRQFSLKLPITIELLKEGKFDGMSLVKIEKFGQQFITAIKKAISLNPNLVPTVDELLTKYPLEAATGKKSKCSRNASVSESINLFNSGKDIEEIASERNFAPSTIADHLASALGYGYNLDMNRLISIDTLLCVLKVIDSMGGDTSRIGPIKTASPENISYDNIKFSVAYYEIRNHLSKLKIPYKDDYALVNNKFVSITVNVDRENNNIDLSQFVIKPKEDFKIDASNTDNKSIPDAENESQIKSCNESNSQNLKDGNCTMNNNSIEMDLEDELLASINMDEAMDIPEDLENSLLNSDNIEYANNKNHDDSDTCDELDIGISDDKNGVIKTVPNSNFIDKDGNFIDKDGNFIDNETKGDLSNLNDDKYICSVSDNVVDWGDERDDDIFLQNIDELDNIVDNFNKCVKTVKENDFKSTAADNLGDSLILIEPCTSADDVITVKSMSQSSSCSSIDFGKKSFSQVSSLSAKKRAYINDSLSDGEKDLKQNTTKRNLPTWLIDASKIKPESKKKKTKNKLIF